MRFRRWVARIYASASGVCPFSGSNHPKNVVSCSQDAGPNGDLIKSATNTRRCLANEPARAEWPGINCCDKNATMTTYFAHSPHRHARCAIHNWVSAERVIYLMELTHLRHWNDARPCTACVRPSIRVHHRLTAYA